MIPWLPDPSIKKQERIWPLVWPSSASYFFFFSESQFYPTIFCNFLHLRLVFVHTWQGSMLAYPFIQRMYTYKLRFCLCMGSSRLVDLRTTDPYFLVFFFSGVWSLMWWGILAMELLRGHFRRRQVTRFWGHGCHGCLFVTLYLHVIVCLCGHCLPCHLLSHVDNVDRSFVLFFIWGHAICTHWLSPILIFTSLLGLKRIHRVPGYPVPRSTRTTR